jgi:hypothetical protein
MLLQVTLDFVNKNIYGIAPGIIINSPLPFDLLFKHQPYESTNYCH